MPSSASARRTGRENDPFSCEQPVAGTPPSTGIIILGSGFESLSRYQKNIRQFNRLCVYGRPRRSEPDPLVALR